MFPYGLSASIRAVLFDFDGTLTMPDAIDFAAIRREMGCPPGVSILEYIESLGSEEARRAARSVLEGAEDRAARAARLQEGAVECIRQLRERGVGLGIITRNSRRSLDTAFSRFDDRLTQNDFDIILTRDSGMRFKPEPDGVLHAAERFELPPARLAVVGDFRYDTEAARAAGALAVYLAGPKESEPPPCDLVVHSWPELADRLDPVLQLPAGKVPNRLLARYLPPLTAGDRSLLVGPAVGEDVAVIEPPDGELIAVKSDPVTFLSTGATRAALTVNANDIATSGAEPRWFQCTLLFPEGTSPCEIEAAFSELAGALSEAGAGLTGGHSEITDAVTRTVVSGTLIGTVPAQKLVRKTKMRQGDVVLITKAAGIEGTAILAAEFASELTSAGASEKELAAAREFDKETTIVKEARIARSAATAMHDVTEGGVVTALAELSLAGGHELSIQLDRIPVRDVTRTLCDLLGADPLGLIGSGALLLTCGPDSVDSLVDELARAGIDAAAIGTVGAATGAAGDGETGSEGRVGRATGGDPGSQAPAVRAFRSGREAALPTFNVDELARLYAARVRGSSR
ncbi:HAD-IA family hydrolase [Salinispira pacifica]